MKRPAAHEARQLRLAEPRELVRPDHVEPPAPLVGERGPVGRGVVNEVPPAAAADRVGMLVVAWRRLSPRLGPGQPPCRDRLQPSAAELERYRARSLLVSIRGHRFDTTAWRSTLIGNAARKVTSWLVPEGLLLGAAVASLHLDALREAVRQFAPFAPIVVFGLGFLLALRFQRSRLVFALLALALVEWGLDRTRTGDVGRFVWQAAAVLLPLNLAAVMLMSERGIFTRIGLARMAILLAQVGAVAAAARYVPSRAAAIVNYQAFPREWFGWTPLAQLPLVAFLVAAALIIAGLVLQASSAGRAFLWALAAALLALHSVDAPVAATIYGSTAGLMLIVAVIEASYLMAYQDGLTGLPARRALTEALHQINGKFTIAMVDVDHFKKLNDRYGHDVGDQVLRMLASRLAKVSNGGRAFRYGGEEFAILFPGDGVEECLPELETLRQSVEESKFMVRRRLQRRRKPKASNGAGGRARPQIMVTVSIGAAESNGRQDSPELVVQAADRALYRAKGAGRNRVES